MHNLKELIIWKRAIALATNVYQSTKDFPAEEKYGLTAQIRKSAISIPSNIAEGAGRNTNKEFNHFLGISNGSCFELQTQLIISKNLGLIGGEADSLLDELDQLQKMNYSLQNTLR
ncbi:four helix bundle protein [Chryseosolibacter indicus]|uniref:Four helix bundle protein n=1 Tax=Chryseosolibacter indicus TaxID=2782351 RepID=A0ABS5VX83_9BACT|nr:four helix bundle protein [Chryseosolibacter indicus]MBT1706020.1 four helix bundle protein [Chryseosolibacter indicus]